MKRLRRAAAFVNTALKTYDERHCWLSAAAIAFFALLSLTPLLILGTSVTARVMGSDARAMETISGYLHQLLPIPGDWLGERVQQAVRQSNAVSAVMMIVLVWTATGVTRAVQAALRATWGLKRASGWHLRLRAVAIYAIIGLLLVASLGLTTGIEILRRHLPEWSWLDWVTSQVVSLGLGFVMFFLVYSSAPTAKVAFRHRALAALAAAVLFDVAKWLFAWYAVRIAPSSPLYGGLGAVVLLLLWVYYSASILLFGATLAHTASASPAGGSR